MSRTFTDPARQAQASRRAAMLAHSDVVVTRLQRLAELDAEGGQLPDDKAAELAEQLTAACARWQPRTG
jgi:hypothetical protein